MRKHSKEFHQWLRAEEILAALDKPAHGYSHCIKVINRDNGEKVLVMQCRCGAEVLALVKDTYTRAATEGPVREAFKRHEEEARNEQVT